MAIEEQDCFNMEEFLNFNFAEPVAEPAPQESAADDLTLWESYPPLWKKEEAIPAQDPISQINFEGASLIQEDFVDPFAVKNEPTKVETGFRERLISRRNKLDLLAKNLSKKKPIQWAYEPQMDCKQGSSMQRNSWIDFNPVRVHSVYNIEFNIDSLPEKGSVDTSKSLEGCVSQSINLYNSAVGVSKEEMEMANSLLMFLISHM
ncbi:hypothetical protein HK103_003875 [Boothiomyces macroporosus]|uniref:Uncharacterized protein n=1 Tax=Boothiomyces macroporosus TaxID=261099 RepID=A0AAD5Y8I5_9FUNG|nr:hypothetical protein HK103_003875 [Boothiomyces macroporosus]